MHTAPTLNACSAPVAAITVERPLRALTTHFATRPARVCWLVFAIAVLSLADLHMTLEHLTTIGMGEANPIARLIMSTNSPAALIAWKLTSVAAACLAFYAGRRRPVGEVAAWFCCLVLIWLIFRWGAYSTELASVCPQVHFLNQADTALWVTMTP